MFQEVQTALRDLWFSIGAKFYIRDTSIIVWDLKKTTSLSPVVWVEPEPELGPLLEGELLMCKS
jgi:hypothetical protein